MVNSVRETQDYTLTLIPVYNKDKRNWTRTVQKTVNEQYACKKCDFIEEFENPLQTDQWFCKKCKGVQA